METAYNIISESVSLISRRKASTKKQWIPDLNSKVIWKNKDEKQKR